MATRPHTIRNETALTTFSIVSGIAGGLGAIIASNRLAKGKSVSTKSVAIAAGLSFIATFAAVYLLEPRQETPSS